MRRWAGFFFVVSAVALVTGFVTGDLGHAPPASVAGVDLLVREGGGKSGDGWGSLIAAGASALIGLVLLLLRTRGDQQSNTVKNPVQPKG
ncbi:hypothetical protein GCM10009745_81840 [Kribbella yunnanensis]|uniref:Uncharacterized protein n=1 Tax=Kribbella yunnanensis TaxID=190194 RepID=A0ABN2J8V0_9ACTN